MACFMQQWATLLPLVQHQSFGGCITLSTPRHIRQYLVIQVWPIDAVAEHLAALYAQHILQVAAHALGCCGGEGYDGHIWELLLQDAQLLVVGPAQQSLQNF